MAERAYKETIRRVWDSAGHWYTQVAPDPDGCPGMSEISRHEIDHTGKGFEKVASILLHEEELHQLVQALNLRLHEAREESTKEP